MKTILFLNLFMISFSLQAAVEKVTIRGNIKGLGNEEIVLLDADYSEIIKGKTINGHFELSANVETGDTRFYTLHVPSIGPLGPSMSIPTVNFFIDSPKINIRIGLKDKQLHIEKIKGSPAMEEYDAIFKSLPAKSEIDKLLPVYNEAFESFNQGAQTEENEQTLTQLGIHLDSLEKAEAQEMLDLIPSMQNSKVLAMIINLYHGHKSYQEVEKIKNLFDPDIQDCYGLKQMQEKIDFAQGCAIGKPAPDFELKDSEGKLVKLSSLRGKYTLIDFWASWCGPCRQEIPNLKKVYAEFKDKGLQLIGVSLDAMPDRWHQAIKEEQLDYLQLNDPKNLTGKLYNFNGIPFIILISPEGIILAKNLRGNEVREEVIKYINPGIKGVPLHAGQSVSSFQLQGKFTKLPRSKEIRLHYPLSHQDSNLLSVPIQQDGSFTLKGNIRPGSLLIVQLASDYIEIPVFVENQTYTLTENEGNYHFQSEKPISIQNRFANYLSEAKTREEAYNQACIGYDTIRDIHHKAEVSAILSKQFQENENFRLQGIQEFAGTEIAQYLLWKVLFMYEYNYKDFTKAIQALGDSMPDSPMKKIIFSAYETLKAAQLTGPAPEFTLPDKNGKKISLTDFRGKYLLVDFWASWCAPCREKNKHLYKLYPALKAKGLEVISISLDNNQEQWLKAVKEDQVNWIQLNDPDGFKKSEVREAYKVQQVPTVYLIDPSGNIVTKNPTPEEIDAITH